MDAAQYHMLLRMPTVSQAGKHSFKSHLLMYSTIKVRNGNQATLQGRRL
jgi:hypothetical protein